MKKNIHFTRSLAIAVLSIFLLIPGLGWGQLLTFEFSALAGSEVSATSNSNDVNLTSSTITRGAGLTASANGGRFNATSWALTSIANAVSGNDYMEFTITPNPGYQFSVSSIYVQLQRSSTGPSGIALRSSVDNYTSNLDIEKAIIDNTSTQNFTFTFAQSNSTAAVTYRFYKWAEADGGSGGIGDGAGNDIIVNGTVTSTGSPTPTLTADATSNNVDNNIDITFTPDVSWEAAITDIKIGGTALTLTTDYVVSSGNIQLIPSGGNTLLQTAGSKDITVEATGYSVASVTQDINAGAATKLGMKTQPTAPAANGAVLAIQPAVYIQDQYGNTTTSTANVDAAVGAGTWTLGGGNTSVAAIAGTTTYSGLTATSAAAVTGATVSFTSGSLTGVTSGTFDIPAPVPFISVGTITTFGNQEINTASSEKTYNVSGINLTADIIITPPAGFEISTTSGSGFVSNPSSLTLTQTGGSVASTPIYVVFNPTLVQAYSGNITHESTGAITQNVASSGTGTAPVPTLPHFDPINYTAGQGLQTQADWSALNSGDDLLITSGSLSYPGLVASTGNKVTFNGIGIDAAKLFTQQTSGTVYYSFLLDVTALGSLDATGGYFSGFTEGTSNTFGATIWTRLNGADYDIGINPRTTVANTIWSNAQTVNNTLFIVASYQIVDGAANDVVKLWINPTPGVAEPTATLTATNNETELTNVNRILIRQDSDAETPFIEMDELRIGTSWVDVTPAAPPTITTFTPDNVCAGSSASVIITGTNFTGATAVKFNGVDAASYTVDNATQITATSPTNATTGTISVTTPGGTATSSGSFTVNPLPVAAGIIAGTATVNQGNTGIGYSVPAITNATSYVWAYTGSGATITGSTESITIDFSPSATSGDLTVYGQNACGDGVVSAAFTITVNTPTLWAHMLTTGVPIATKFLGDKLNPTGTWFVNFEIGQTTWTQSDAGIGKSNTDPSAWDWRTAPQFAVGAGNNRQVQADFGNFQFTSTGNWYINGRAQNLPGDAFNYANDAGWQNTTTFAPTEYFTVNDLTDPSAQTATAASVSQINLSWTQDATPHLVMIVRKKSTDSWTEPTQGTAYAVNDNIGAGVVVQNGSGTSLNNTGLDAGTTYDYKFYSENYSYYSAGVTASATTFGPPTAFNVTGTGSYCTGGLLVGLDDSELGVDYQLYIDGTTPVGSTVPGTGAAIDFGIQTVGIYTVEGTNINGTTAMAGSADITTAIPPSGNPGPTGIGTSGAPYQFTGASASNGTVLWTHDGTGSLDDPTLENPIYTSLASPPVVTVNFTLTISHPTCPDAVYYKVLFLTPAATTTTWTGATDENWNDITNWSDGIPGTTTNVNIPAGLTNYPTVSAAAVCNNITVQNGATLIDNGNLTLSSGAKIIVAHAAIAAGNWHYISSPVSGVTSNLFLGNFLYDFNTSTNLYTPITSTSVPLTAMKGFALYPKTSAFTASYVGGLNPASNNFTISAADEGWNLIGNPYPSAIDWDAASGWTKTGVVDNAIYIYDGSNWRTYVYSAGTGRVPGTQYIAPTQGFFVKASSGGTMTMTNAVQVHNTVPFYKSSNAVTNLLRLEVSGNGYQDDAVVRFLPEATAEFDGNFDAYKRYGDKAEAAQFYTLGSIPLAINSLPEIDNVAAGIKIGAEGSYTIAATEMNDIPYVTLEDTETGIFTDLSYSPYTFTSVAGTFDQRFILHFSMLSVAENKSKDAVVYSYQQTVHINLKNQVKGDIFIYNIAGQLVASRRSAQGTNEIKLPNTGNYIVKVISKNSTVVRKVFIQ